MDRKEISKKLKDMGISPDWLDNPSALSMSQPLLYWKKIEVRGR